MTRYVVTLTDEEIESLKSLVQKGGKGYRIRHAQILLKLDQKMRIGHITVSRMPIKLHTVPLPELQNGL